MTLHRNWIAIASAEHVARGRSAGFMQVCHGKGAPLRRLSAGDCVVYYSPTMSFGGKDRCQSFTAIGAVCPREPYQFDMGGGFIPFRRDVVWQDAHQASILPLLDQLDFTKGKRNWGYAFRFGLLSISAHDMACIAGAMQASGPRQDVTGPEPRQQSWQTAGAARRGATSNSG